ncbi:NAD(P)H-binding protein [Streptomyces acidiscabies]|uniref:NAD(P)H-binding protein n=3 Tax=Streptomyces acidiscabies TaxID=42234 RepID=A0AAP6B5B5_9ACTN|nr:NAD(P)H-binding protein [Streptomyces acidiscabies]MBP5941444.1 NAD(P)H-binding protein [Streptomyces sp. LBUM 1476]MBZ3912814.1 NAD(P)H-binding protein [Streptomyces acidiscabies]MDX2958298.1 NAD(P)H-binding protein [Streptomyces acidiscabies]MDX3018665.1 NAD(P)H-binding protein [Streptomyces acidiscabies]MDX3791032.1 NAD(P)H-binding protein [Streptomyces acidiscabies]
MSTVRVLVTGAGGTLARHVAHALTARGVEVRAGSRTPAAVKGLPDGTEVLPLDLTEPDTFAPALDGVDGVFLYCEPRGIEAFTRAAVAAGVGRLTVLSSASVVAGDPPGGPIAAYHARVEETVAACGLPWTFVRAGTLATGTLAWASHLRTGVVRAPYGDSATAPVHEADVAAVAVAALTDAAHAGRAYVVTGPESLTRRRQAEILGAAVGRGVRYEDVPPETAREELRAAMPADFADTVLAYLAAGVGHPAPVEDTVARVTGRPARTFAQWAADHAADFR